MRKTMTAMILILGSLLLLTGCKNPVEPEPEQELKGDNKKDYGKPYKACFHQVSDDRRHVAFGLIADSHIDASYAGWCFGHSYRDTDHVKRNREVIHCINIAADKAGCLGIVHLGDMVDKNDNQNLVAFRQLYECSYPGYDGGAIKGARDDNYDAYSCGYRINKTVYPTLGNHDVPPYHDGNTDWREAAHYIKDRIIGASGLKGHYNKVAYAWRWGQYYFINLGLWAGSYEHQSSKDICYKKLQWLEDFLAEHVGDSGLGVVIFQHYGWDGFSRDGRWWSKHMRNLELDVLMRRPLEGDNTVPGNPYNVIGIFTGHDHSSHHIEVFAGKDSLGNDVHFDNIVIDDSGESSHKYGFSIVYLTGDKIKIRSKEVHYDKWSTWEKPIHLGP